MRLGEWAVDLNRKGAGWRCYSSTAFSADDIGSLLLAFATKFGVAVPGRFDKVVEPILPQDMHNAPPRSLSALYGLGELPFHMDSAHNLKPARWLVIGCVDPGRAQAQTRLIDMKGFSFSRDELNILCSAPLLVRTGRGSFYSSILDRNRPFLRYDPGCMEPVDPRGEEAMGIMQQAIAQSEKCLHTWSAGEVLMIDNWRLLHGRSASTADARLLLRVGIR